ncbi:MAG: amidase [Acidobacteriota bacterium]
MLNRLSLTQLAAEIASGRASAAEAVESYLREIEARNPRTNAFVSVLAEEARAAAKNAPRGPLHGVPITIKDSFDVAGRPTYCGSKLRLDHRAAFDATPVAKLRAAGAIVLGKTNCPEFLYNYETDNHIAGRTNNPWNFERTSGGSSGGEAAAIASFCSAGGMGSDGGGSIREPAHFCGIAGLKPTPGRVSGAGHWPLIAHPGGLLGVCGPMARTAADVRLLFETVAGYDDQDPFSAPVPVRRPSLDGLRVGLLELPADPAVTKALHKAARTIEGLGFVVEPVAPRSLERAHRLWWFFFGRLAAPFIRQMAAGRERDLHWTGCELIDRALEEPAPRMEEVVENLAARDAMRAALLRRMRDYRVLLAPPCAVTAFPHRDRSFDVLAAMSPLTFSNLLGLPALVIPFDVTDEKLPSGVQLIAGPYGEELLLELAVRMEEARGPFPLPEC